MLTEKIKALADAKSQLTTYDSRTLTTLDKVYINYKITVEVQNQFKSYKQYIIDMFDDPKIVEKAYQDIQKLHYSHHDQINEALSEINTIVKKQLIAECHESNNIYPELVRVFIKPDADSILNEFIQQNTELKKGLEALKKLPFIKELQADFKDKNPTNEALVDAFKRALSEQRIGIRDKIKHFLHICYKWIYETLIGPYDVKSTLEEEKRDAHNTFKSFLEATELKITNQKEV